MNIFELEALENRAATGRKMNQKAEELRMFAAAIRGITVGGRMVIEFGAGDNTPSTIGRGNRFVSNEEVFDLAAVAVGNALEEAAKKIEAEFAKL